MKKCGREEYPIIRRNHNCYMINKILMINEVGEIAIIRESKHMDRLYLPSKKANPGETIKLAAIRTMREETGLEIFNPEVLQVQIEGAWIEIIWLVHVSTTEANHRNTIKNEVSWLHPNRFQVYRQSPRSEWSQLEKSLMDKLRYPEIINTIQLADSDPDEKVVRPHVQTAVRNQAAVILHTKTGQRSQPLIILWPCSRSNQDIEEVIAVELQKQHGITTKSAMEICLTGIGSSQMPAFQGLIFQIAIRGRWNIPTSSKREVVTWQKAEWKEGAKIIARI